MSAKPKKKPEAAPEPPSGKALIMDAARVAYAEAHGDLPSAAKAMKQSVWRSRALRDALTEPLIERACYDSLSEYARQLRKVAWNPGNDPSRDRIIFRALSNIEGLLDLPIPYGPRLAECSHEQIMAGSEFDRKQGQDMMHKSRFLALVGQSVPDGKQAGEVLNEDRLQELQQEAFKNGKK